MKKLTHNTQSLLIYSLFMLCFSFTNLNAQDTLREIIVKFEDGTPLREIEAIKKEFNATELEKTTLYDFRLWELNKSININDTLFFIIGSDTLDSQDSKKRMRRKATVNNAGWNHPTSIPDGLESTTAFSCSLPITCPPDTCSVKVAVIDTGVDTAHPYLKNWTWIHPYDFINNDAIPNDENGHGTHVAGTIVNMAKQVGANSNSMQILPLKTQDKNGDGKLYGVIEATEHAIIYQADIINFSLGYQNEPLDSASTITEPLGYVLDQARMHNILVIASAGNDGLDIDEAKISNFPAAFKLDNIISVAASDCQDNLYPYSNYGMFSVNLSAPGTVNSTYLRNTYKILSGTSMATAIVSGGAALLATHTCDYKYDKIRNAILSSVDKVNLPVSTEGRINLDNALEEVSTASPRSLIKPLKRKKHSLGLHAYPVPFKDRINLEWYQNKTEKVTITISDVLGRQYFHKKTIYDKGQNKLEWSPLNLDKGLYLVTLVQGLNVSTKKIIYK